MIAGPAYERALFTGFRNLVIEQFEHEPAFGQQGGLERFVKYVPTGGVIIDGNVEEGPFPGHGR